jgi:hypothetical protein
MVGYQVFRERQVKLFSGFWVALKRKEARPSR